MLHEACGRHHRPFPTGITPQSASRLPPVSSTAAPGQPPGSLQLCPKGRDIERPHVLRIHLQIPDIRAGSIHPRLAPPDAGTEPPTRIEIPVAGKTLLLGLNQCILLSLAKLVLAGLVGAGGLGAQVTRGLTRMEMGLGLRYGLAIFLDRILRKALE